MSQAPNLETDTKGLLLAVDSLRRRIGFRVIEFNVELFHTPHAKAHRKNRCVAHGLGSNLLF